jgi:hypothetical protein
MMYPTRCGGSPSLSAICETVKRFDISDTPYDIELMNQLLFNVRIAEYFSAQRLRKMDLFCFRKNVECVLKSVEKIYKKIQCATVAQRFLTKLMLF